jgi:putative Mn2+ efflux pump MntP
MAHVLSSLVIGLILGIIGYKLSKSYTAFTEIIAATILVIMGFVYISLDFRKHSRHHEHLKSPEELGKKSHWAIILTLSIAMFFTPCLEIEAYYFQAGIFGWSGILLVSLVYLIITISIMVLLVYLGLSGINKFKSHFLEHHDKLLSGIVLLVLGVIAYFIKY